MSTDPRIVTAAPAEEDTQYEAGLRPRVLDDYIGQDRVRENLLVAITAAKQRGDALDHVLLHGPPGLGKTTLAYVIGNELGVQVRATSGPAIEKPGDLLGIVTDLSARDVLFIDEIHRMSPAVEEILYPALEDFEVDIVIGDADLMQDRIGGRAIGMANLHFAKRLHRREDLAAIHADDLPSPRQSRGF